MEIQVAIMARSSQTQGFGKPKLAVTKNAWRTINWAKVQRMVFKLQKRIYQAAQSGQLQKARRLQRLLLKSYYARLLAVRRVTQDNQGKKTAGVDGVKTVSSKQRFELAEEIKGNFKAKPLRRVWIPKPGQDEKRPLGIPTIRDRAKQALVKMALEPYWEPLFEETSYGFRPGRSTHDAIARIYLSINKKNYYVLDADIAKCFDQIDPDYLLSKLRCPTSIRRNIKQWLKAGVMDNGVFDDTETGTPQGGVISPLIANIALNGMVRYIGKQFPKKGGKNQAVIVRYADDFVVMSPERKIIEQCQIAISEWLKPIGLQLKPEKTRICHTLQEIEVKGEKVAPGFDFLGFNFRQYPVGKHRSGKSGGKVNKRLGFKTHIKPDKGAIKAHIEKVKEVIKKHKTAPQAALIKRLNPIIMGWAKYYSGGVSSEIFGKLDNILWQQLRAWIVSRCGNAKYKTLRKYFHSGKVILSNGKERNEKWIFQTQDGLRLQKHNWTPNVKHKLVKPDASTYDGNWVYWATRRGKSPDIPNREAKLLKDQKGKCKWCGQHFTIEDQLEIDHITPRSLGGKDDYKNLQLLHRHCHDQKTAIDGSMSRTHDHETTELGAV